MGADLPTRKDSSAPTFMVYALRDPIGANLDRIQIVIHPQSIVHSLVEFEDGAMLAQLSHPDMRLPIQYALTYPQRWQAPHERLDWTQIASLDFEPEEQKRQISASGDFQFAQMRPKYTPR